MNKNLSELTNVLDVVAIRDAQELGSLQWMEAEKRLRELLEKKYEDEAALSLNEENIPTFVKDGFTPIKGIECTSSIDLVSNLASIAIFVPRTYCEYNSSYKQIIPYVVAVTPSKKYFLMERIEGDARLIGKGSIGIGGHINVEDEGTNTIVAGAKREIREEVQDISTRAYLTFEGFIYDPSNNVGLDHIGFVFFLRLPDESISIKECDKLKGSLATKEELAAKYDKMENWSQIVYDNLIK